MNKYSLILSLFLVSLFAGCEILDVDPYHSMPADQAITDARGVERALIGCYDAMQGVGYYGRNYVVVGDLSADQLIWSGTTAGYDQINNNNILADNVIVEGIWASIYIALNRVNNVIHQLPSVDDLDEQERKQISGELHFLRALHHYNLMRLFGPIPLRTMPATAEESNLNQPRQSIQAVIAQIEQDLEIARENMRITPVRGRATLAAAYALTARLSLDRYYREGGSQHLENAVEYAGMVIDQASFDRALETDFARLFDGTPNRESIFEIEFNEQDRNRFAEYFFHTSLSGRYEFAPDTSLINSFAPDDLRLDVSVAYAGNNPYGYKYNDIVAGTDNVYVFRLAEMHLIRAEALTLQQAEPGLIHADINPIRVRAGLQPTTVSNHQALLLEIETQRRKEFAFEGHRWFDLIRTGRALQVLDKVTHINQTLFPIPLTEILANNHEGMYQNEGY